MYELTDKEHDAVLQLNDEYREAHFKQKAQSQQGLYILLGEEGPFMLSDLEEDENQEKSTVLPVWCHEKYAQDYAEMNNLSDVKPQFITAKAWNEYWVKALEEAKVLLGFMPINDSFNVGDVTPIEPNVSVNQH